MFGKLKAIKEKFEELTIKIADPEIIKDIGEWRKLVKEHAALEDVVTKYQEYLDTEREMAACREMMHSADKEMAEMGEEEYYTLKERLGAIADELKILLIPKNPNDSKNVIVEIRPGAGGEEASLFGAVLLRMYQRFAERLRWKIEDLGTHYTELGGINEAIFMLSGKDAYAKMKYESGVHRVQRVPETESQGRVHTSTATVAVLPEAQDVDIEINEKDLKIDTFRSGGAGGQHVNTTDSAVRITHLPTGIVVSSQDERSQIKNREKGMKILRSRLLDYYQTKQEEEYAENRKSQVGRGDRSERIRTYNYPQGRVSDHRIGLTLYSLDSFLDGDLFQMIEALQIDDQNKKLLEMQL
ncbi:MAG: peptide chain release factor 1 [Christensenellales bacterium]|jgi:peptide chain release factor 1